MLTISQDTIYLAQSHALATCKRGIHLVAVGKSLKQHENYCIRECGYLIVQQGLLVQEYARQALTLAEQLTPYSSTQLFTEAVQARSKAIIAYSQAMFTYIKVVKGKYKAARIRLNLADSRTSILK